MKRILLLLALVTATASAQTPVCKIYGRVDSVAGPTSSLTAAKGSITITRAAKNNTLFLNTSRVVNILPDGTFNFYAPRTTGTDTALIHVKANFGDLAAGQILYVPDADSAELRTMVRYTANPQMVVVAVPAVTDDSTQSIFDPAGTQKIPAARLDVGAVTGDTTGTTNQPMQSRLEDDVKAAKDTASAANKAANTADGKATDAGNVAHVALNVASGARDSTSINGVKRRAFTLTAIGRLTITQTNDSTFEWSLDTTGLMQGPRITALEGSVAAAQDSARKANDSARVIGPRATSTANDLTAHIGTADAHLPSQTGASGKFLQSNGTVSSWQPALTAESDPTALAKASSVADSSLTNGTRSISSSGRIFVPDDSITFVGEAGDVIDARLGNVFRGTISANDTLSISNMIDGQIISIVVTNAGTHTLSWTGVNWAGGTAPTLSATANKRDVFTIIRAGGIMYGSERQDMR